VKKDRTYLLLILFLILSLIILIRLIILQIVQHEKLKGKAERQRTRIITLAGDRGDIFDRNGRILATSLDTSSIYVNPRIFKDTAALSNLLGEQIGPFDRKKFFAWVKRKIEKPLAQKIEESKIVGVFVLPEIKRVYPKDHLASQLIGFCGMDNEGLSGLELSCDQYLKGVKGRIVTESDPSGFELLAVSEKDISDASPGMNLTLTIDETIQYLAESRLEAAIKKFNAVSGCLIVMDVKNGEILALAGKPDFNPNEYSKFDPKSWKTFAVDVYEPGSTFKVITAAAGLDEKAITIDTKLKALDSITVGGKVIKNSHQIRWEGSTVSVSRMLEQSINTGVVQVGLKLGPDKFYKKIKDFGFGDKLSINLPGESAGILRHPKNWYKPDIAMITFGQSIAVTPIQLICAIASIGNGGQRIKPLLIKKIESVDGSFVKAFKGEELNRTISAGTAKAMIKLLENVVLFGSGKRTKMTDFRVGGKTGTAQKASRGIYLKDKFIASFVGFAPLTDPRIAALVIVNEPRGSIWGESVAGPVFKEVVEGALRYLNVAPDMVKSEQCQLKKKK
jgi:cell division protein FtsI/penicillin-binding protein 2